jgi:hypothetical protein
MNITEIETKDRLTILVEGENLTEVIAITVRPDAVGHDVITQVAVIANFHPDAGHLFCEDGDGPLDPTAPVHHDRIHHVHRAEAIEVTVSYMSGEHKKSFPPSTRVQRVLDWAVGPHGFAIDPSIAPEMELNEVGQPTPLPKSAHIGRFVKHPHHKLHLDLTRGVVPNG